MALSGHADVRRVRARPLLAVLVGVLSVVAFVGAATTASAGRACLSGARDGGYSYAGHQAAYRGHGVRATIMLTRAPTVDAGHVAGWVGVGGPGQGANGGDAWIQAGIASMPGTKPFLYAEITREGRDPQFILVEEGVSVGERHSIAVLELAGRPGWWRVWVDGEARDAARPHARLVGTLGADRDGRELERRHAGVQRVRLPLRARLRLVRRRRLVASVRLGTSLPRRHARAARSRRRPGRRRASIARSTSESRPAVRVRQRPRSDSEAQAFSTPIARSSVTAGRESHDGRPGCDEPRVVTGRTERERRRRVVRRRGSARGARFRSRTSVSTPPESRSDCRPECERRPRSRSDRRCRRAT